MHGIRVAKFPHPDKGISVRSRGVMMGEPSLRSDRLITSRDEADDNQFSISFF